MFDSKKVISDLGGATALAKKLGFHEKGAAQRVQNWKARGIPAGIILQNPKIFKKHIDQHKKIDQEGAA